MKLKCIIATALVSGQLAITEPTMASPATEGQWSDVMNLGLVTLHGMVLPDGKVLGFGSDSRGVQSGEFVYSVFDPITNQEQVLNNTTKVNIFCANMAIDPATGDIIISGGDMSYNGDNLQGTFGGQYSGHSRVIKYDYTNPSVRPSETGDMTYQRWYGSILTLNNGEILSIGGRDSSFTGSQIPEIYNHQSGYRTLDGARISDFSYGQGGLRGTYYYPYVWQASDNDVWMIEPESEGNTSDIYRIDVTGNGSVQKVAKMPFKTRTLSPSVMYDVDTVLITDVNGGVWSGDLSQPVPTWEKKFQIKNENNLGQDLARTNATFVPMPDGKVAIVGGSSNAGGLSDSQFYGQASIIIWDPETNEISYTAKQQIKRLYHSIGLMLPDGRVYTAGGGAPGINRLNAEIFSPPYLFNDDGSAAVRPVITAAPKNINSGDTVAINVDDSSQIEKVTVIKSGSATHGRTSDSRVLTLDFTVIDSQTISIDMPENNILSPGLWFLSTVNDAGVPASSRIIGVNMADLEEVPNLAGDDTVIYDIESEEISGPFELTVSARFDELVARSNQTVFDFGNGVDNDNIILAQVGNTADLKFEIYDGAIAYTLIAPGVIDEDEIIDWKISVTDTGTMMIFKNGSLVAEGQGAVPNNVERANKLIGRSSVASNDSLLGLVRSLRLTNNGIQEPEVPPNKMPMIEIELSTLSGAVTKGASTPASSSENYTVNGIVSFIDMDATDSHTAAFTAQGDGYLGLFSVSEPVANDITTEDTVTWQFTVPHSQIAAMVQDDILTQNYTVTITDNNGAMAMTTVVVTIIGSGDPSNGTLGVSPLQLSAVETNTVTFFTASASGGTGEFQYKWRFGDDSPETEYSGVPTTDHTYTSPGNYTVTLTVKDSAGEQVFTTAAQAVYLPRTNKAPGRSSSIVFDAPRQRYWNVNPDNNSVSVFTAGNNAKLVEIAVGKGPRSLSLAPDGDVWVSNYHSGTLSVIDGDSFAIERTVSLGSGTAPFGIVFSPVSSDAYIAAEGSAEIVRINTDDDTISRESIGGSPRHLAVSADGQKLYIAHFITAPVTGEDTATPTPGSEEGGEVTVVDTQTMSVLSSIYLATSTRQDTEASARGIANYLGAPVISPDGSTAWIPSKQDNIFKGRFRDGTSLRMDQTVRAISSKLDLTRDVELPDARVDFDDSSVASAGIFDLYGTLLFTALETSREVAVLDAPTGDELFRFGTGFAPQGMALSDDGRTLYVHNFMSRSIGVYDLNDMILYGIPAAPQIAVLDTVANERLSAEVLLGKQLFYDAADDRLALDNYMSCASCHNDGGHDGRVWDMTGFGEGLRNTISLNGRGGVGHGALHWSANFDEIQDFEAQIRAFAGGSGLMADIDFAATEAPLGPPKAGISAELDAMAAYVNSLSDVDPSPYRNADGSLTSAGVQGRDLFAETGCASCHGGETFTDSDSGAAHNIGTIDEASGQRSNGQLIGIDSPSLLGVWATGPYLHDGSARTLEAAVRAHGNFNLPDGAVQHLVAYLKQIDGNESVTLGPDTDTPADTFSNPATSAITLDGNLEDWANYTSFGNDADDIPASEPLDWREAWMAHDIGFFYLAMQNEVDIEPSWGQTLYIDTDGNSATGFNNGLPLGADYVIQGRFAYRYAGDGGNWQWDFVQILDGSFQQGVFEYRIPRALLDNVTSLTLGFVGSNLPYGGTAEDVYPDDFYNSASDSRTFTYTAETALNSVPVVSNQTFRVQSGDELNITLAATDFDNDTLTYTLLTQPATGSLTGTAPELSYIAPSDFEGDVLFSYRVNDGVVDSALATVQINVVAEGSLVTSNQLSGVVVDGSLSEWESAEAFAADPADTLSETNPIDYRRAWLAHDSANFYLAYEIEQRDVASIDSWGFNTYIDIDRDGGTGYLGTEAIGSEFLLQGAYLYRYVGDGASWAWSVLGEVERALDGTIAEIGIPRDAFGNPSEFDVVFIGDNLSVNGGEGITLDLYPDGIYQPNTEPGYFSYTTEGMPASDNSDLLLSPALAPETPFNGTLELQNNPRQPQHTGSVSAGGAGSVGGLTLVILWLIFLARRYRWPISLVKPDTGCRTPPAGALCFGNIES